MLYDVVLIGIGTYVKNQIDPDIHGHTLKDLPVNIDLENLTQLFAKHNLNYTVYQEYEQEPEVQLQCNHETGSDGSHFDPTTLEINGSTTTSNPAYEGYGISSEPDTLPEEFSNGAEYGKYELF